MKSLSKHVINTAGSGKVCWILSICCRVSMNVSSFHCKGLNCLLRHEISAVIFYKTTLPKKHDKGTLFGPLKSLVWDFHHLCLLLHSITQLAQTSLILMNPFSPAAHRRACRSWLKPFTSRHITFMLLTPHPPALFLSSLHTVMSFSRPNLKMKNLFCSNLGIFIWYCNWNIRKTIDRLKRLNKIFLSISKI